MGTLSATFRRPPPPPSYTSSITGNAHKIMATLPLHDSWLPRRRVDPQKGGRSALRLIVLRLLVASAEVGSLSPRNAARMFCLASRNTYFVFRKRLQILLCVPGKTVCIVAGRNYEMTFDCFFLFTCWFSLKVLTAAVAHPFQAFHDF